MRIPLPPAILPALTNGASPAGALLTLLNKQQPPRRAVWSARGRTHIEVRGVTSPNAATLGAAVTAALERYPGVRWARMNAVMGRVVVQADVPGPGAPELVAVVEQVERAAGLPTAHKRAATVPPHPADAAPVRRAIGRLAGTTAALGAAAVGQLSRAPAIPAELAALVSAVELYPRVHDAVVGRLGPNASETLISLASVAGQSLAHGTIGLAGDALCQLAQLSEVAARRAAWELAEPDLAGSPECAEADAVAVERPTTLPRGPIERYGDRAAGMALAGFAVGWAGSGNPRRGLDMAVATLPKATKFGREGFATQLGRILAQRGVTVIDPGALRRLDRIDTVVLDVDALVTGALLIGDVLPLSDGDAAEEYAAHVYDLFAPAQPLRVQHAGSWSLGPIADLSLRGRRGVRAAERLRAGGACAVLGLARGRELLAVVGLVPEPAQAAEALAAAAHRAGVRLLVTGDQLAVAAAMADGVVPGGDRLAATVRSLQADGAAVLLVSRRRKALAHADVGVGIPTRSRPAWGAHILTGTDLNPAALLIDAIGVAHAVSRRSVGFAQAGAGIGAVGALTGTTGATPGQRALMGVNGAATLSLASGAWAATELSRRPLSPPLSRQPWHALRPDVVLKQLSSSSAGLDTRAAERRRHAEPGSAEPRPNLARAFALELANPLTPILAAGAALSAAVGSLADAGLVAGVGAASALVGAIQQTATERAVEGLFAGSAVRCRVLRDGRPRAMPAADLVAGDVVVLAAGDVVPADCRVLSASGLEADESALTGESVPVAKTAEPILASALAERASMLYEGTTVAAGRGRAVVVATGASTEAGRTIAATRRSAPRGGVEARLNEITNVTLPTAVAAAGAVAGAGLLRARPLRDSLGAGVGLAVASVPEGLPFLVNAAQLAAARRLSAIGALVRDPRSIEALGRVDVLCFDKTGTLTAGRITLTAVADATTCRVLASLSARHRRALAAGLRATPQPPPGQQLLHLTDRAVSDGAEAAGVARDHDAPGWQQLMALPFEPSRGYHATLGAVDGRLLLSVKGAPELVLDRCTEYAGKPLTSSVRRRLLTQLHELTARGHRVLAVAEKVESRPSGDVESLEDPGVAGLDFLGFLALADPVRRTAVDALQQLRGAGVQIVMITGDHPGTAAAIADELGLPGDRLTTGADLDALDDRALDALLPDIAVVARSTPAHKIRVVEAFQRLHRVVAMTGDGANDAAAIRLADVGIALGHRGTPAARAAADLVVTDDQLETIVAALVEGRSMWASVRQALGILVGGNLGEIGFTVLAAGLTGSSPLSARQLLLVNLLTDLVPALAIAVRPPTGEPARLLAEGPEVSLGSALTHDIGLRAVVTATGAGLGWGAARLTGRSRRAGTVALVSLVGTQLGQTVVAGRAKPGVVASSVGSAAALMGVVQTPGVSQFFGCTPIGPVGWAIAGGAAGAATLGGIAVPAFARWARGQADVGRGAPQVPARYAPQATTSVS